MRVALLPRALDAPSTRVRLLQYQPALAAAGVESRVLPWDVRGRADHARYAAAAVRLARWADVVVLHKPALSPSLLRTILRVNPHVVVDVDDAVWVTGGSLETTAGTYAERFAAAVRAARQVVVGSDHLAGEVARFAPTAPPVVVRPSVVGAAWGGGPASAPPAVADPAPPVLGWVGSPQNLRDFRPEVLAALRSLVADGRARVRVVTSLDPAWPGVDAEVVPWSEEGEVAAVGAFAVGLMPLTDDPRSRGRCGYKAIQCLAAGVPVVASPVGAAPEIVGDDERGVLADGEGAWRDAVVSLLDDPARRRALGAAGRRWVEAEATVEATTPVWLDVLRSAAG